MFSIFIIMFFLFIITLSIVAAFLLLRAIKIKMWNLIYGGTAFLLIPIGFIGNFLFQLGTVFEEIFVSSGFVLITVFTNLTFHRERENIACIVLTINILLAISMIFLKVITYLILKQITPFLYYLRIAIDIIFSFLTLGWISFSSLNAYNFLKHENIEPWIKMRYKVIGIVSLVLSFHAVPQIMIPWNVSINDFNSIYVLLSYMIIIVEAVIFSFGYCIAWIMPERLKAYFNRSFTPSEETSFTKEEELIQHIKNQLKNN